MILNLILLLIPAAYCANILFSNPLPSRSHFIWNNAIAQELIERGHNVTMIDSYADTAPKGPKYHPILMKGMIEQFWETENMEDMIDIGPFESIKMIMEFPLLFCEYQLNHSDFQMLMNYPEDFKFDMIIFDITLGYCHLPLIQKFKYPPAVGLTAFLLPSYLSFDFGNHLHPGYLTWYGHKSEEYMTFSERFWNHLYIYYEVFLSYNMKGKIEQIARKVFGEGLDSFEKMENHISLLLSNTDPILDVPQPLPPNIIAVGGLHARPSKKLPKDIEDIMNGSKQGVIVVSFGTNVNPEQLPKETIQVFLSAFKQLKYNIIWKFKEELKDLPKNVFLKKWLPQNDILDHPNTVLFIGHGGALSTHEAVYHGIPVLAVPFVADQHINAQSLKLKKRGDFVNIKTVTTEVLLDKINNLLNDPIYAKNIKETSKRLKGYPQAPLKKAADWIEYSLRNNGTHFLNPKSRNLPFIVSSGIDILLFITTIVGIIIYCFIKLGKLFRSAKKTKRD